MNRKFMAGLVMVAFLSIMSGMAWAADSQPSSKATAAINKLYAIGGTNSSSWVTESGWVTIHSNTIKTANYKDLFIDVSLQSGLYTQNKSELKVGGTPPLLMPQLEVRVLVDNVAAEPGIVIFDKRVQTLNTKLYQSLMTYAGTELPT